MGQPRFTWKTATETEGGCLHVQLMVAMHGVVTYISHTHILRPLSGTIQVSHCQKKALLEFMVQEEISEADTQTIWLGATPSGLIGDPSPSSPHFYAGFPSCHNPPDLSWLATAPNMLACIPSGLVL